MKIQLFVDDVRLIVRPPLVINGAEPEEVVRLAAAASCNGSRDPGDLALINAARRMTGGVGYAQATGSCDPPTRKRRYGLIKVRPESGGEEREIARGEMRAVMELCGLEESVYLDLRSRFEKYAHHGYRPVSIAVRSVGGQWRFLGVVPMIAIQEVNNIKKARADFRYFMIWDWELRLLHWCWVLCVTGLCVTGICIAEGWFLKMGNLESGFQFGYVRFIHYVLAWVLIAILTLRFSCFFFATNKYQTFSSLFPIQKQRWIDLFITGRDYLYARSYDGPRYIGHNPLQQWTYTGVYGLFTIMVVTGLALYALYAPEQSFYRLFMPVNDLLGVAYVRLIHLIGLWCFLLFVTVHVYLSILAGNVDRDGTISSMFSGGRWLRKGVHFQDE